MMKAHAFGVAALVIAAGSVILAVATESHTYVVGTLFAWIPMHLAINSAWRAGNQGRY